MVVFLKYIANSRKRENWEQFLCWFTWLDQDFNVRFCHNFMLSYVFNTKIQYNWYQNFFETSLNNTEKGLFFSLVFQGNMGVF